MNKKKSGVAVSAMLLMIAGWTPMNVSASHTMQTVDILSLANFAPVRGAATITRDMNSAWVNLYASGLKKKSAYTVWWVIFNDPSLCGDACGDEDADFEQAGVAACYAGGFVTGTDGVANVSVHLEGGDIADGQECIIPGELAEGNGYGAEIHVVIRSHGRMIRGRVDEQTGSYLGACDVRDCEDTHAAVFLSVVVP